MTAAGAPAGLERPVDLAPPRLPVAGGVTALVVGALHLLIAGIVLIAGIIGDTATGTLIGAIYAAIVLVICGLAGLTLRGNRGAAITVGVVFALGAAFCVLGLVGLTTGDEEDDAADAAIFAAVALLTFLVPSLLCFRDARRIRLARSATLDHLKAAFH